MQCSFHSVSSKICGSTNENKTVLPLKSCHQNIYSHLLKFNLTREGITSEFNLLKYRGGYFESNGSDEVICPVHRDELGVRWRRPVKCMLGWICHGKYKALKAVSIGIDQSRFIFSTEGKLIPVGSGACVKCRSELLHRMGSGKENCFMNDIPSCKDSADDDVQVDFDNRENYPTHLINQEPCIEIQDSNGIIAQPEKVSPTSKTDDNWDVTFEDIESSQSQYSEWIPEMESSQSTLNSVELYSPKTRKRKALNDFLVAIDVSPVKKTLQVDWNQASERTKSDYMKKATEIMKGVLSILAPCQEDKIQCNILENRSGISVDKEILKSIAASYSSTSNWGIQRQLLSVVVTRHTYPEIKEFIPHLTKYRFTAARKHVEVVGIGMPVNGEKAHRERASQAQIDHFIQFVTSPAVMTDAPFGVSHFKLSSGEELSAPKIILNTVWTRTVQLYSQYCKETNFSLTLSDRTYMRMLEAIQPAIRKCMKGLDNYAAEGASAFDELKKVVSILTENGQSHEWGDIIQQSLINGKQYMKVQFKLHICKSSEVAHHCCCFALTSGNDKSYSEECQHEHCQSCKDCDAIVETLGQIEDATRSVQYRDDDQKDDCCYIVQQSVKAIYEWKNHILRSVNQDRARNNVLENLKNDEVLLERDWAMKFLPMQYRESQSKWFAKRGLSWHVGVATYKTDEGIITSTTFIHVFNNTSQDAVTSTAILSHTLKEIQSMDQKRSVVFIRSDNAGCFHSSHAITCMQQINISSSIKVKRMDFSDPQGGKGICDRKAAHIKANIRRYVNEGHNVVSAEDFKNAVASTTKNVQVFVCLPPDIKSAVTISNKVNKIAEISTLNNFLFEDGHITAWKQYEIGKGKKILEKMVTTGYPKEQELVILSKSALTEVHIHNNPPKEHVQVERRRPAVPSNCEQNENELQLANIFSCPEDGCILTFIKYGNLMNHLDSGNHKYANNLKDVKDRTRILFTSLMESKEDQIQECMNNNTGQNVQHGLKKGWALKTKRDVKRFSADQKEFLMEKFAEGERTGHKCDPEDVSKEMRTVKNVRGTRRFSISEFLTPTQIGSYFSRLSLKKRQDLNAEFQEEDLLAEANSANLELITTACNE